MKTQSELIGNHPLSPNIFTKWLLHNDTPVTATKSHRSLTPLISTTDIDLIKWLGNKLIEHHYNDDRLNKLKERYKKLGFTEYAEQSRKLPRSNKKNDSGDKTKKGNATEIILIEYVKSSLNKELIHSYKLRYNPNVDQAMKGDDTLMIDFISENKVKIYLGEAKFRATPVKKVVEDIAESLSKDKRPLSYTFLVDELGKNIETKDLADLLDNFIFEDIKGRDDLIYTGLLLSDTNTSSIVERHLNSDNSQMVLISIGIENPEELINKAFERAEYLVNNPSEI